MATAGSVMYPHFRVVLQFGSQKLTHYHDGQSLPPDRIRYLIGYSYGFPDHYSKHTGSYPMTLLEMLFVNLVLFCKFKGLPRLIFIFISLYLNLINLKVFF